MASKSISVGWVGSGTSSYNQYTSVIHISSGYRACASFSTSSLPSNITASSISLTMTRSSSIYTESQTISFRASSSSSWNYSSQYSGSATLTRSSGNTYTGTLSGSFANGLIAMGSGYLHLSSGASNDIIYSGISMTVNYTVNATTYIITYKPGSNSSGSNYTQTKNEGTAITLRNATYTRSGYTQTGWSLYEAGTTKHYNLGASYTDDSSVTLYPYWTANASETINPTGISISKTSMNLTVGGTDTVYATVSPSNATNRNVYWSSSNTSVATVSSSSTGSSVNITVTAVGAGSCTITASTAGQSGSGYSYSKTCSVTVTDGSSPSPEITDIGVITSSSRIKEGNTFTMTLVVEPSNANYTCSPYWSTNNFSLTSFSGNSAILKAINPGNYDIGACGFWVFPNGDTSAERQAKADPLTVLPTAGLHGVQDGSWKDCAVYYVIDGVWKRCYAYYGQSNKWIEND